MARGSKAQHRPRPRRFEAATVTIRLDDELAVRLSDYAINCDQSWGEIGREALRRFLPQRKTA